MELMDVWLDEIGNSLREKKEKISVVESVTSGFLQLMFSQIKEASSFYCGGVTVYTLREKVDILKVNRKQALECNCVSKEVTESLGRGAMELFKSDWVIAVTGYATPVIESGFKLFAFYSIHYKDEVLFSDKINLSASAEPLNIQRFFAESVLREFNSILKGNLGETGKHDFANL